MKKFFILILSCCFALVLAACANKGGGNKDDIYDVGAVFQVRRLSDTATEDKTFDAKNELKTYVTENFADDCYFCVFGENGTKEIFDNIGADETALAFSADLYLNSGECLIIYYISYNATSESYALVAGAPTTTNVQMSIELKLGANENYRLKANLIPKPAENENLAVNKTVHKSVKSGKTEYFRLTTQITEPLNLAVSASGEVEVGLYRDGRENIVGSLMSGTQIKASYYIDSGVEYYLAVHNKGADCDVDIQLKNVENLELGKEKECIIDASEYFTFTPQISSEVIFGTESQNSFSIELYDGDHKFLAQTSDSDSFSHHVDRGKTYYVLLTDYSHKDGSVKIYTCLNPLTFKFGSQKKYQSVEENCYRFAPPITAEYTISLTANQFEVFDPVWERVTAENGRYPLKAEDSYYVYIKGTVSEFTVDIGLYHTTDTEGVIPPDGEVIVKFVPDATAEYSVEGAESVEWYNCNLLKESSILTKGKTYFVIIKGEAGAKYSIKKEYTTIQVDRQFNLFTGAYSFTVETAGEYTVMFYCGKNTVSFTLYNADGTKIKEYSGGSGEISLNLAAGEYTFDLAVSEPTSAGVIIKSVN